MKNKVGAKKGTLKRLFKMLFEFYPVLLPMVLVCVVLNAMISSVPAVFQQNIIAVVEQSWQTKDWGSASGPILKYVSLLIVFYVLSLAAGYAFSYGMAIITQGSLKKLRVKMFNGMQAEM
ncbi:MAG: ABC transporter ATP-binding protein, partial [Eisenbergiella sp.]